MSARNAMTHRALVQRDTSTGTDDYGQPNIPSWITFHTALACHYWTKTEREVIDGQKTAVIAKHRLLVPAGTDIKERDRVASIRDRSGNTLVGNTMLIRSVIRKETHIELDLEEYSGGN